MMRSNSFTWRFGIGALSLAMAVAILTLRGDPPVAAQAPANADLTDGLRFVPANAAMFAHVDVAKLWNHPIVQRARKTDPEFFALFNDQIKKGGGFVPEDVKSLVLFMPKITAESDSRSVGFVVSFHKEIDKPKVSQALKESFSDAEEAKILFPDAKTALILVNMSEAEYGKPHKAFEGPLTAALKDAASGKFAVVAGVNPANLPDEIRGNDVPEPIRAIQPLFRAISITATVDVTKDPTLDVRVKTATAAEATNCERALGAAINLIQEEVIGSEFKNLIAEAVKNPELKDLATVMKGALDAITKAKFTTLGNETRLTISIPGDLPFGGAFLGARTKVQGAANSAKSMNNMKQIALAWHNYHDAENNGPPAAVCDRTGKPLLSWRVLILPYIEQDNLFKEFKLDEVWDSAHNKKLLARMPPIYAMPGGKAGETNTHYRVFVGNGAGWDWIMGSKLQTITDGTSNTIMCVTAADAVPWSKPDELEFDPKKDMTKLLGNFFGRGPQVAMFDGSVRTISKDVDTKTLNAAITKSGGEVLELP